MIANGVTLRGVPHFQPAARAEYPVCNCWPMPATACPLALPEAGTEHGAPRPEPGPGKTGPRPTRPRRIDALEPVPARVQTAGGPVLVIPARERDAVLAAAMFAVAIEQARRAASRTASPTTSCT